jgi:inorganic triphosphatase YgiF
VSGATEEREVKLAVPDDFVLPTPAGLAGVAAVDRGRRTLDAVYWDTPDLQLARAGAALRHRNGTWTYKGLSRRDGDAVVREEHELDAAGTAIPEAMADRVGRHADPAALAPLAGVRTERHTWDLTRGGERAELVHDRVEVIDGERVADRFAEVEVEYPPGSRALADDVVSWLRSHGAVVDGTAKYVRALRALGHDPPEVWG